MPRSASPPRAPRQRSSSPRRERGHDRDRSDRPRESRYDRPRSRSRDRGGERNRDPKPRDSGPGAGSGYDRSPPPPRRPRSPSPPPSSRSHKPRTTKELSFYKKSTVTPSGPRDYSQPQLQSEVEETARERFERRDRGEVPGRFGGTREAGVRNTMSLSSGSGSGGAAAGSMGSFKRSGDPLDRMGVRGAAAAGAGGAGGDQAREERMRAMDRPQAMPPAAAQAGAGPSGAPRAMPSGGRMIEVIANDRMGRKVRVKCLPTDTVGDLKKLIAAQTGTTAQKIQLKKWYNTFKDHVTLRDYEINDGMSLEMY